MKWVDRFPSIWTWISPLTPPPLRNFLGLWPPHPPGMSNSLRGGGMDIFWNYTFACCSNQSQADKVAEMPWPPRPFKCFKCLHISPFQNVDDLSMALWISSLEIQSLFAPRSQDTRLFSFMLLFVQNIFSNFFIAVQPMWRGFNSQTWFPMLVANSYSWFFSEYFWVPRQPLSCISFVNCHSPSLSIAGRWQLSH